MNQQQWDKHEVHLSEHIEWPANRDEILAACDGADVDEEVLQDLKDNLPMTDDRYTKEELYDLIVG